jgi:hypothetical protein
MRGELPREEVYPLVRHLLAGCPACREVTRRLWELGEKPLIPFPGSRGGPGPLEGGNALKTEIETAQTQLREIVRDLEASRLRLLEILKALPPSLAETDYGAEMDQTDPGTEIRTVIQCVINDSLAPAIGDLRDLTALP